MSSVCFYLSEGILAFTDTLVQLCQLSYESIVWPHFSCKFDLKLELSKLNINLETAYDDTSLNASNTVLFLDFIRNAITKVALLDIPIKQ